MSGARIKLRDDGHTEVLMAGHGGGGNSDSRTGGDGQKPQGGSRGSGDRTNGNSGDGQKK